MPARMAPELRAAILEDIRARDGRSARVIGKARGVSDATVRRIAKQSGIDDAWSRDKTKKATEANKVDHAAVLAKLASRAAGVAAQILESFEAMDADDWASVSPHSRGIILGICSDKARELAPDNDEAQVAAARSLLNVVFEDIVARYGDTA